MKLFIMQFCNTNCDSSGSNNNKTNNTPTLKHYGPYIRILPYCKISGNK